jgi:hypothetical protein
MRKRHPLLIPTGGFCYQVRPISQFGGASIHSAEFGGDQREGYWSKDEAIQLCPYWHRTGHGTVRCDYINKEVLDMRAGAYEIAASHFGAERAAAMEGFTSLADMLKECDIRPEPSNEFSKLFDSEES